MGKSSPKGSKIFIHSALHLYPSVVGRCLTHLTHPMAGNKPFPNLDLFPCVTRIHPRTVEMSLVLNERYQNSPKNNNCGVPRHDIYNRNKDLGKLRTCSQLEWTARPDVPESLHQCKTSQSMTFFSTFNFFSLANEFTSWRLELFHGTIFFFHG